MEIRRKKVRKEVIIFKSSIIKKFSTEAKKILLSRFDEILVGYNEEIKKIQEEIRKDYLQKGYTDDLIEDIIEIEVNFTYVGMYFDIAVGCRTRHTAKTEKIISYGFILYISQDYRKEKNVEGEILKKEVEKYKK